MKTLEQLQELILDWAKDKEILSNENHTKQIMKVYEELGELSGAILKGDRIQEEDAFGDVLVTLIILAGQRNIDLRSELENVYNIIKARKGETVNGTFIKSN